MRLCSWVTLASLTPMPEMTSFTGKGPWSKHPIWAAMVQREGNRGNVSLYFSAQLFVLVTSINRIPNGENTWCTWVSVRIFFNCWCVKWNLFILQDQSSVGVRLSKKITANIVLLLELMMLLSSWTFFFHVNQGNASLVLMMMVTMMKWISGCQWHN